MRWKAFCKCLCRGSTVRFRLSLDCRIRNTALRVFSSAFYSYTIEALLLHLKEPHSDSLRDI